VPGERPERSLHLRRPAVVVLVFGLFLAGSEGSSNAAVTHGLGFALLAVVVANLVWAFARVRSVSVRVAGQPTIAVVGDNAAIEIALHGRDVPLAVRLLSSPGAPWLAASGSDTGPLPGISGFRGIATQAVVQLRSDGPLGLVGYSRSYPLRLRPLWIGPRPVVPSEPVDFPRGAAGKDGSATQSTRAGDAPAAVREYQVGDSLRHISWPVSARMGQLITKKFDSSLAPEVLIAVDLGPSTNADATADRTAGIASWLGGNVLDRGWRLRVLVVGPDGPTMRPVDRTGLHCALAEAQRGPLPLPTDRPLLLVRPDAVTWL